jgi:hypothetical protein
MLQDYPSLHFIFRSDYPLSKNEMAKRCSLEISNKMIKPPDF